MWLTNRMHVPRHLWSVPCLPRSGPLREGGSGKEGWPDAQGPTLQCGRGWRAARPRAQQDRLASMAWRRLGNRAEKGDVTASWAGDQVGWRPPHAGPEEVITIIIIIIIIIIIKQQQ